MPDRRGPADQGPVAGGMTPKEDGMREYMKFYIDGQWVDPVTPKSIDVINPATEEVAGHISGGSAADVDKAVKAARKAFETYSLTTREERIDLLQRILAEYQKRFGEIANAITEEMGAPASLAQRAQAATGIGHLSTAIEVLKNFKFDEDRGPTRIVKEPVGVCGMITPWNWPINQIACKVVPALATGCTMVLKPSEEAPFSGYLWAEVLHDADMKSAVARGIGSVMNNSGQSCNAPTRMLVPAKKMDEAISIAKEAAEATTVGDPNGNFAIGPVVNKTQWEKIQKLIKAGIAEGATLVT